MKHYQESTAFELSVYAAKLTLIGWPTRAENLFTSSDTDAEQAGCKIITENIHSSRPLEMHLRGEEELDA